MRFDDRLHPGRLAWLEFAKFPPLPQPVGWARKDWLLPLAANQKRLPTPKEPLSFLRPPKEVSTMNRVANGSRNRQRTAAFEPAGPDGAKLATDYDRLPFSPYDKTEDESGS
jgi:hypothetical protein